MGKYIHTFDTAQEMIDAYNDWPNGQYSEPWLAAEREGGSTSYNNKDYVELPAGYKVVKDSYSGNIWTKLVVNSHVTGHEREGEITSSIFYQREYTGVSENNRYFYYDGTVYKAEPHNAYGELDYYSTTLPDGTYSVIHLKR